ncbi:sensor histidine kinase [Streptomyces sp. NPDC008079]|uniref:sensor histidine kinase n=1 Tax=Streptomyces sp. NPDC008079 TaxID=3364806 RepID=UPI0036E51182
MREADRWVGVGAAVAAAGAVGECVARTSASGVSGRFAAAMVLLALATTVPLAFVRQNPAVAAATVTAATTVAVTPFHALTVGGACAQAAVLHELGRRGPPVAAALLALPYVALALTHETAVLTLLLAAAAPTAAWSGIARRARDEAKAHSAVRERLTGSLVEHTARGERARIARELHDVVAHHISMVAVQAETARLTTPGMPEAGAAKLSAIGDTARSALTEMRRLLGVLREDAEAEPPRGPQPGLLQLNELLDEARDTSGTGARLIVRGAALELDPGVELAAYRIVQEALTNARRHAPGAAVDVELHYDEGTLALRIRDNGPGPPPASPPGGGLGLLGMRERAAAVGGELRTGPAYGGGFLVETVLPANSAPEQPR